MRLIQKKATKWEVNVLRDFLYQKQKSTDLETYSAVMTPYVNFMPWFRFAVSKVWQVVFIT